MKVQDVRVGRRPTRRACKSLIDHPFPPSEFSGRKKRFELVVGEENASQGLDGFGSAAMAGHPLRAVKFGELRPEYRLRDDVPFDAKGALDAAQKLAGPVPRVLSHASLELTQSRARCYSITRRKGG